MENKNLIKLRELRDEEKALRKSLTRPRKHPFRKLLSMCRMVVRLRLKESVGTPLS